MRIPSVTARRRPRIEIVPLIDIVFFLLATFVMVSMSMIKNRGIPVELPRAATGAAQEQSATVAVTVTEEGRVFLDKAPVTVEELASRLRARHAEDPQLRVVLHGDELATYGQAIAVLDEIRRIGITSVVIQTAAPVSAGAGG